MAAKVTSTNMVEELKTRFGKHITDFSKYLEIHKLGPNQRTEVKRRQEEVRDYLADSILAASDEINCKTDETIKTMIDDSKKLFDDALEKHAGETKKHIRWVVQQFEKRLAQSRQAHRLEIRDTIALDKALNKEEMREAMKNHAADVEKVKEQFKESIKTMNKGKMDALRAKAQMETVNKKLQDRIQGLKESMNQLKINNEGTLAEMRKMQADKEEWQLNQQFTDDTISGLQEEVEQLKHKLKVKNKEIKRLEMFAGQSSNQAEAAIEEKKRQAKEKEEGMLNRIRDLEETVRALNGKECEKCGAAVAAIEPQNFSFSPARDGAGDEGEGGSRVKRFSLLEQVIDKKDEVGGLKPHETVSRRPSEVAKNKGGEEEKKESDNETQTQTRTSPVSGSSPKSPGYQQDTRRNTVIDIYNRRDMSGKVANAAAAKQEFEKRRAELQEEQKLLEKKHAFQLQQRELEKASEKQKEGMEEEMRKYQEMVEALKQKQANILKQESAMLESIEKAKKEEEEEAKGGETEEARAEDGEVKAEETSAQEKRSPIRLTPSGDAPRQPSSPDSAFSTTSSEATLEIEKIEERELAEMDDYSESTWNDIPIDNYDEVDRRLDKFGGHYSENNELYDDSEAMTVKITRTMSGNDLDWSTKQVGGFTWVDDERNDEDEKNTEELDKIDASIPIDDSPTPQATTPKAIEKIEMVVREKDSTPIRGNMHARPKQKAVASNSEQYGIMGLDGGVHPIVPGWVNQGQPKENMSQYLSVVQDLEASLREVREENKFERQKTRAEIQQLKLVMKEKDLLLTEVVKRLKKTKREKVLIKERLDKMQDAWDNDIHFRGFDVEGLGAGRVPQGPRSQPVSRQRSRVERRDGLGRDDGDGLRPRTAGALGINRELYLRRNLKSSDGVKGIRRVMKGLINGEVV